MKPRYDKRARHTGKGASAEGHRLIVPAAVLNSPNYRGLSHKAKALILDMGARYNGFNNGNLALPWSWMKAQGWKSKDTLQRAIRELLGAGMIELTRQGGMHAPSLYAYTWFPIHEAKVPLDVPSTLVASAKWRTHGELPKTEVPPRLSGQCAPTIGSIEKKVA
jgi:hypothetical protein